MSARRTRWRERGAELVEFALVLPLLLFVMVGIVDFGFLFRDYGVITNAAREGARVGVLAGYSEADVQGRATAYMTAAGLTAPPTPTYELIACPGTTGSCVRVTTTYPHDFTLLAPIASLVGGSFGSVTLRAVSVMRVEAPS